MTARADRYAVVASWLRSIAQAQAAADAYAVEIERIRSGGLKAVRYDRAGTSGSRPNMVEARLVDDIARTDRLRDAREELLRTVDAARATCYADQGAMALWMHFVEGLLWREVASCMGFSESYVRRAVRADGIDYLYPIAMQSA